MERWLSWSKAHDWKSCRPLKGLEGSNPSLSARKSTCFCRCFFLLLFCRLVGSFPPLGAKIPAGNQLLRQPPPQGGTGLEPRCSFYQIFFHFLLKMTALFCKKRFSFFRFCRIICLYAELRTPLSVSLSQTKKYRRSLFPPVCKERLWIFFLFSPYAAAWPFSSMA